MLCSTTPCGPGAAGTSASETANLRQKGLSARPCWRGTGHLTPVVTHPGSRWSQGTAGLLSRSSGEPTLSSRSCTPLQTVEGTQTQLGHAGRVTLQLSKRQRGFNRLLRRIGTAPASPSNFHLLGCTGSAAAVAGSFPKASLLARAGGFCG